MRYAMLRQNPEAPAQVHKSVNTHGDRLSLETNWTAATQNVAGVYCVR